MNTKIIATIGPASSSKPVLTKLAEAGVSIFRLNFSHGDRSFFKQAVEHIRNIELELGKPCTIMQDLSGPKIRIGILPNEKYQISPGDKFILGFELDEENVYSCLPLIPFEYIELLESLEIDDRLVLADGGLEFYVLDITSDKSVIIEAAGFGTITSKKGLAIPGKVLPLPAITEKDKEDLKLGIDLGVDAVAMSFVQSVEDIYDLRYLLNQHKVNIPIVAKLERQRAIDNLESIVNEADMIMVARGDLGVECPLSALPGTQKSIISICNNLAKPVIVATQMLLSMVHSISPTRAEVTDVANAVLDGADCVMLSEETAVGDYPVETVIYMRNIIENAEAYFSKTRTLRRPEESSGSAQFLAYAACLLAEKSKVHCLAAHSTSGSAARLLSSCKPKQMIYVVTPNKNVYRALNFSWGVTPIFVEDDGKSSHLERVEKFLQETLYLPNEAQAVITAGDLTSSMLCGTNLVKIFTKTNI